MIHPILDRVRKLGYAVFTNGDWNLNIVGIRKAHGAVDKYDDWLHVVFKQGGQWVNRFWQITTDPGLYYLTSKDRQLNPAGTAVLVPGQYRGAYKIDKHGKSRYEALCQRSGTVNVFRDNTHDSVVDYGVNEESGYFGINIHASSMSPYTRSQESETVGAWSGGCQVFKKSNPDFREFMKLCRKQVKERGWDTFTYTLLDEW